jgi:hypothetical protein
VVVNEGCNTPVKVQGGADVTLSVTTFYYPGTSSAAGPATTADVKQLCSSKSGEFVAAP